MKTCKVLVVQDDDDARDVLTELLREHDFPVEQAPNGHEAVKKLQAGYMPDVIISDLLMPVMDGYALTHELKRHEGWAAIPLIILSGAKPNLDALSEIEAFLQIPIDAKRLVGRVDRACARKEARA